MQTDVNTPQKDMLDERGIPWQRTSGSMRDSIPFFTVPVALEATGQWGGGVTIPGAAQEESALG